MKTEPASNETKISVRDKILHTAHDLFYSTGFKATGVDTLIKEAKVTKVTFYRHFPSKSLLILAYLHYRHEIWMNWFEASLRRNLAEGQVLSDAISATLCAQSASSRNDCVLSILLLTGRQRWFWWKR